MKVTSLYCIKHLLLNCIYNVCIYTYIVLSNGNTDSIIYITIVYILLYNHVSINQLTSYINLLDNYGRRQIIMLSRYSFTSYYLCFILINYILIILPSLIYLSYYLNISYQLILICLIHGYIYYIIISLYILLLRRYSYNYYVIYILSIVILTPMVLSAHTIISLGMANNNLMYAFIMLLLILKITAYKSLQMLYTNT